MIHYDARHSLAIALEKDHGHHARWIRSEKIREQLHGRTVWEGTVEVFDFEHSPGTIVYAWNQSDDDRGCMLAVFGTPEISTARDAVRAALVAELSEGRDV
jgi:hypothetical protein